VADEITTYVKLSVTKNGATITKESSGTFTQTGTKVVAGTRSIGFSSHSALPMGDVTTAGWAYFKNLDGTNYVEVGKDVSGTFHSVVKIKPGETAEFRLALSNPYAKANTAAVLLDYAIAED
jgi:hypothetical protein